MRQVNRSLINCGRVNRSTDIETPYKCPRTIAYDADSDEDGRQKRVEDGEDSLFYQDDQAGVIEGLAQHLSRP